MINDSAPRRDEYGRFARGNPGRRFGSRNRMSQRVALGLLRHYARNEDEILARLMRGHFDQFMRMIGRLLPQDPDVDWPGYEDASPDDVAVTARAVRAALERIEAGRGSLADIEDALLGMCEAGDAP
jgi:hypothetical protein